MEFADIITLKNYSEILPKGKESMYLQYVQNGFAEDSEGTMYYNRHKDVFVFN